MIELPFEVLKEIYGYLPSKIKVLSYENPDLLNYIIFFLSPLQYMKINKFFYNNAIKKITIKNYNKFYMEIVKKNNILLFKKYIDFDKMKLWFQKKKYNYKKYIFSNFVSLLLFISNDNKSEKCKQEINFICEEMRLDKNKFKNMLYKNIKWI